MEILVFLPGILGSKLATPDGEEVWPPTPVEVLLGYKRIDALLRPDLKVTGIIEKVCIDAYGSILETFSDMGYSPTGTQHRLVRHAYDWRQDLIALSDELGTALNALIAAHGPHTRIKIVCHSMGGLVTRALLEGPDAATQPWYKAVELAVFLATPHEGAPLAFARAIGVGGSTLGLNPAQLMKLAAAVGYPAAYQLFPHADLQTLWKLDDPTPFNGASPFDMQVMEHYGLNQEHMQATRHLHARLDERRRPTGCRYFSVVSATHETVTRFDEDKGIAAPVSVKTAGDGTVPIRSAAALRAQTAYVEGNHLGIVQKPLTHKIIGMLLGAYPAEPFMAAHGADGTGFEAVMNLSVSERMVATGRSFEIVVTTTPQNALAVRIRVRKVSDQTVVKEIPITVQASAVERIAIMGPQLKPGQYMLELIMDDSEELIDTEELLVTGEDRS